MSAATILDLRNCVRHGNRELLTQVLQMFHTDCRKRMKELNAAAASQDWTRLCRETHTLKGSLGALCAGAAYAAALRLRRWRVTNRPPSLPRHSTA